MMEQLFLGGIEPHTPKRYWTPASLKGKPNAWFGVGDTQLELSDVARTPDTESPIAYVGSKHRLYKLLLDILPRGVSEIVSPFAGGASLELKLAATGIKVHAYDIFEPIMEFFHVFNANAAAVVERVQEIYPIYKGDEESLKYFLHLTKEGGWQNVACPIERAAITWAVNKQSYMRLGFAGSPIKPLHAINVAYFRRPIGYRQHVRTRYRLWSDWHNPNITFNVADFRESLSKHSCIAYLDPPYIEKEGYYGAGNQGEFAHAELRDILAERQGFVMSYGNHPMVHDLYRDFTILKPRWSYGIGRASGRPELSAELLIISNDIEAQ